MCLRPIKSWTYPSVTTGEIKRSFTYLPNAKYEELPCGKCFECAKQYTREWTFRICDESRKHTTTVCLTLTFDDDHLPVDLCVRRRPLQLFIKSLRKAVVVPIRYFGCGEYGGKNYRPHYHLIVFGYDFSDKYYWCKSKSGGVLYRSPSLDKLWKNGFAYIGDFNPKTAQYCAKYLQKFAFLNVPGLSDRTPPFTCMSTHPGIGGDFRPCLSTDKLYYGGKWVKTPRYYLKQAVSQGFDLSALKSNRDVKRTMFVRDVKTLKKMREIEKKLLT